MEPEHTPLLESTYNEQKKVTDAVSDAASALSNARQALLMVTLLSLHFCVLCSDSFLYPFFSTAAKKKGLVDSQIGFVYAAYEIIRCLAAPLYGILITTLKPREMCFLGTLSSGLAVASFGLIYYAADGWFFPLCLIIRILAGNGSVMFTVAMTSGLMKATTFKSTTIIAAMDGSLAAGYATGPLIGAGLYKIGGYVTCFVAMGSFTALLSFFVLLTVPKIEDVDGQSKSGMKEYWRMISIPGIFIGGFLAMGMSKLASNMVFSFTGEWMISEFHISETLMTTYFTVASICYILCCWPVSHMISKGFVWSLLVIPTALNCLLMLIYTPRALHVLSISIEHAWWYPVINFGVQAALNCALYLAPYEASLHLACVNGYERDSLATHGLLAGVINSGLTFGASISPMISGTIVQRLGFEYNTLLSGTIYFVMTFLYIIYLSYMNCSSKPLRPPSSRNTSNDVKTKETTP